MTRIFTHKNVDLDATISVCMTSITMHIPVNQETVQFVDAETDKVPLDAIPVDIQADKHRDGKSYLSSHFSGLLPEKVINEVIGQDQGESLSYLPLQYILLGMKMGGITKDIDIINAFMPIVKGWVSMKEQETTAQIMVERARRVSFGKYTFIVFENTSTPFGLKEMVINIQELTGEIYWRKYGCGIKRFNGRISPDFSKVKLDGWFAHPSGHLLCFGSRKSPKHIPPPQFEDLEEFLYFLKLYFKEKETKW